MTTIRHLIATLTLGTTLSLAAFAASAAPVGAKAPDF